MAVSELLVCTFKILGRLHLGRESLEITELLHQSEILCRVGF